MPRCEYLQIKMTREEKELLEKVAEHEGRPMGNLLRWLVEQRAEQAGIKKETAA